MGDKIIFVFQNGEHLLYVLAISHAVAEHRLHYYLEKSGGKYEGWTVKETLDSLGNDVYEPTARWEKQSLGIKG